METNAPESEDKQWSETVFKVLLMPTHVIDHPLAVPTDGGRPGERGSPQGPYLSIVNNGRYLVVSSQRTLLTKGLQSCVVLPHRLSDDEP